MIRIFFLFTIASQLTACAYFEEQEKLIQFSDETQTIAQADRIQIRVILKDDQQICLDTLVRFVGKAFFNSNDKFNERFLQLRKGERYQWKLPNDWTDPFFTQTKSYRYMDLEVLQTWSVREWLSAMTQMSQQSIYPEDSVMQWIGQNWIGDQPWDIQKDGLMWRWLRHGKGAKIDTSMMISTWISTHHLNGESIGEKINITAKLGNQQQWISAIQWVIPYLQDGDSVEIVSKSQWTYEHPEQFGIPPHSPLKFYLGAHDVH